METSVRYNRFNEEYITIPVSEIQRMKYICTWNIEESTNINDKNNLVRKEKIFNYILDLISNYNKKIYSITIKQDNALYKELFTIVKKLITMDTLENAYKIALLEGNTTMIEKINKLKEEIKEIEQKVGISVLVHQSDIAAEYGKDVANYIWENDSLEDYIKKQNGILPHEEDRHVFLYENGKIEEIDLPIPTTGKTKIRTIN